jgi:hypothetical protein
MGKFDNIFNTEEISEQNLSPEESVAAIAVVTAIADSSIKEVDIETLASILWEFEVFEEYSEEELIEVVTKLVSIAKKEGLGILFNTANEFLTDDLVLDGFAGGVIMLLDEQELIIPQDKMPFIKQLQSALELEDEEAEEIIGEIIAAFEEADNEDEEEDETVIAEDYQLSMEMYESPSGNFTVLVPVDPHQGGRVQTQEGIVSFSDDYGALLRIDYYPIPPEQMEEMELIGQEKYLQSILVNKYVPQAIVANLPDAQVELNEYLEDTLDGSYYVLVNMPKGSTVSKQEHNGNASRLDAYRGLIAFINSDFLYIVSSQRSFFEGDTRGSVEEESESIKQSVLTFVDAIEFT